MNIVINERTYNRPSTLTEEQREIIKEQHEINSNSTRSEIQNAFQIGCVQTFEWLFGENFFQERRMYE